MIDKTKIQWLIFIVVSIYAITAFIIGEANPLIWEWWVKLLVLIGIWRFISAIDE